jgi:acetyl esterase/lipase
MAGAGRTATRNGWRSWRRRTAHGIVFASIGYRLAPAHVFPAACHDCAQGVQRLMTAVADFGGNPARLYAGGHSAGGHYAALLATRADWWRARGHRANPLSGCLPVSGVFRFGEGSGLAMRPRFLGPDGTERAASPIADIEGAVPFLIAHGERDFPHLIAQAVQMETALSERGTRVERIVIPGADHFAASYAAGDPDGVWVARVLTWLG